MAVLLLLVGAISKSALFPFHFWLPAAMAAPTPVSAYLHAAAMVKAGVYLVALLAPAFAGVPGWRGLLLSFGLVTMLLGGLRALRQYDLKLLLAYGTVSQLGFLLVVLGIGTRAAALAGLAMLIAHALFKATLFLVVGIVDHQSGTRDLRELSGLGRPRRSSPALAIARRRVDGRSAPADRLRRQGERLGALIDVARHGDGTGLDGAGGWSMLLGVVLGSVLTVAYTARFLWGAFASKPGRRPSRPAPHRAAFLAAPAVLAALVARARLRRARPRPRCSPVRRPVPADGRHEPGWRCGTGSACHWCCRCLSRRRRCAVLGGATSLPRAGALARAWSAERGYFGGDASAGPHRGRGHRPSPSAARWRPTSA